MTNDEESPMDDGWSVLMRLSAWWMTAQAEREEERGDVPGWVMVTVMTAGLVAALWAVAGPELEGMLREALASVR